jgi:hypothetical protein
MVATKSGRSVALGRCLGSRRHLGAPRSQLGLPVSTTLDLTEAEEQALIRLLPDMVENDRIPCASRLAPLMSVRQRR